MTLRLFLFPSVLQFALLLRLIVIYTIGGGGRDKQNEQTPAYVSLCGHYALVYVAVRLWAAGDLVFLLLLMSCNNRTEPHCLCLAASLMTLIYATRLEPDLT